MRHLPSLLPYALASAAVVVASAIALGSTVRGPLLGAPAPTSSAEPAPLGSRAALSDSGRMAYWRTAPSGQLELWVSDLDGGRRWTVATAPSGSDITLTRWSPDGNAVAYVLSGQTLVLVRLDGSTAYLEMPGDLRAQRWRIVSFEWSPDSSRVAATFRAGSGLSNVSDVHLVNARAGSAWERITVLGDGFAGRWASPTQLFVEEPSGAVLVMDLAERSLRPLTGIPAASPLVGRDGRVYFVGGQFVGSDVISQPVASGWVWSATLDGDELRREIRDPHDSIRLFGVLADGRLAVGVPGGVYLAGESYVPLAFQSGTVRRVIVSGDGKRLIGITDQRILVIDPAKVPRIVASGGLPPAEAATVLLSSVREADVWFPSRAAAPVRSARATESGPRVKLAFILGRALYQQDPDGTIRALATEQNGFVITPPKWSPPGDRVLAAVTAAGTVGSGAVIVSSGGPTFSRFEVPVRFPGGAGWTSDGKGFAVWQLVPQRNQEVVTQVYDADTGRPRGEIAGRATFTPAGTIVLSDGDLESAQSLRTRQRVDLQSSSGTRTITDATKLAASPLLKDLADPSLPARIEQVTLSADGLYLAALLLRVRGNGTAGGAVAVVRVADGTPIWQMAVSPQGNGPSEVTWSSSGHLLAWWTSTREGGTATQVRTTIADPATGATLQAIDGRLAGWADGPARSGSGSIPWSYVARDEGLFAYSTDGAGPVRIGPVGVPIAATKP